MTIELANKTFAFTGTTSTPRKQLEAELVAKGAKTSASIAKSTSYVVKGAKPNAGHLLRAKSLRVKVISEKALRATLAGIAPKKPATKATPAAKPAKPAKASLSAAEKREVVTLFELARDTAVGKLSSTQLADLLRVLPHTTQNQRYFISAHLLGATATLQMPLVPQLFAALPLLKKPAPYARLLIRLNGAYTAEQRALLQRYAPAE